MSRYPIDSSYPHHYRLQVDLPMHLLLEALLRKVIELRDLLVSLIQFVLPQRKNHRVSLSVALREWWRFHE
jgi:hypothetical protein